MSEFCHSGAANVLQGKAEEPGTQKPATPLSMALLAMA
jgi:hypothetical protein